MTIVSTIRLANGREIDVGTGRPVGAEPLVTDSHMVPSAPAPVPSEQPDTRDYAPPENRSLQDMPETGARGNVLALAVALQMFGLNDDEIAMQMRSEPLTIRALLKSKSADEFRDAIIDSVSRRYEPEVRGILNKASVDAAGTLRDGLRTGRPGDRLKAASEILSRTGHAQVNGTEHKVGVGLVIEIVQRGTKMPDLDLDISSPVLP